MDGRKKKCCNHESCPHRRRLDEQMQKMLTAQMSPNNTGGKNSAQILFVEPNFTETPSEYEVFYDCISSSSDLGGKAKARPRSPPYTVNGSAKSTKNVPKPIQNMENPLEFREKLQQMINTSNKLLKSFDDAVQLQPKCRKCKCKKAPVKMTAINNSDDVELCARIGNDGSSVMTGEPKEIHFDKYTLRIEPVSFKIPLKVNIQSGHAPPHVSKIQQISELSCDNCLEPIRTATIAATKHEPRGPLALPSAAEVLLSELVPPAACTLGMAPGDCKSQFSEILPIAPDMDGVQKQAKQHAKCVISAPVRSNVSTGASDMNCVLVGGKNQAAHCTACASIPSATIGDSRKEFESADVSGVGGEQKPDTQPAKCMCRSLPQSHALTGASDRNCVCFGGKKQDAQSTTSGTMPLATIGDSRKEIEPVGPSGTNSVTTQREKAEIDADVDVSTQTSYTAFRKNTDKTNKRAVCTTCTPDKHCQRCKGGASSIQYFTEPNTSHPSFIASNEITPSHLFPPAALSTSFTMPPAFPPSLPLLLLPTASPPASGAPDHNSLPETLSKEDTASYFTAWSGYSCKCPYDIAPTGEQSGPGISNIQYYVSHQPPESPSAVNPDSVAYTKAGDLESAPKARPIPPPKPNAKKYRLALPQHKDIRPCVPCRFDPSPLIDENGNVICPFNCGCCLCPWKPHRSLKHDDQLAHAKVKVCKCRNKGSMFTDFTTAEEDRCSNASSFDFCPCREKAEAKHFQLYGLEMSNANDEKLEIYRGRDVVLSDIVEIRSRRK